jgi:hypothetical protein
VCAFYVRDAERTGLVVLEFPTAEDDGHCEIRDAEDHSRRYGLGPAKLLAKAARILTPNELRTLKAGDNFVV